MKRIFILVLLLPLFKSEAQSSALSADRQDLAIADSLYATGNYTKAINYYAKEGSEKGSLQIARAYNSIGNYDKAIVQYESLISKSPELQIARFELGKLYLKTKRFDEGRKLFTSLVSDDANNPEYLYYQGESFRELDQGASSLVAYKKAVTVDSTHLKSLFQLGKHFVITREKGEAVKYLNMGLNFYPDDVSLINLKGLSLYNNDQYEQALPLFERLIELGEKKEFVYTKLAYCYFKVWEFEKAKSTYKHLIAMDEDNEDAYFNLGHVFYKDRQTDSATYYIKKSIEVQKVTFEKEYESLARFARTEEDLNTSLKYYRLAFDEDQTNYRVYYQICALMDQVSNDPKVKLEYYESFIKKFGKKKPYLSDFVLKRISELKQELHFSKD